jgi:signal transduction histidine kinase
LGNRRVSLQPKQFGDSDAHSGSNIESPRFLSRIMLLRFCFALAISFLVIQFRFEYVESYFYDVRVRLRPPPPPSASIELVAIDPPTIEKLGRVPDANDHSKLIALLREAGARFIVYVISPNEIVGSVDELEALAKTMGDTHGLMIGTQEVVLKGEARDLVLLPPFEKLPLFSAPRTADKNTFAEDNVTRRLMISYQGQSMLHPLVAKTYNPTIEDERSIHGTFEYLQSNQTYIDFRPAHSYPPLGFADVIARKFTSERFRDKIVIIGRDIQSTPKDYVLTPYSRDIVAMTLLELHANIFDTLIRNSSPTRAPRWVDLLITTLISILTVYVVLSVRPARGLAMLVTGIVAFSAACFLTFWLGHLWIEMTHPFVSIFICYYFFIPYRLIIENRKSWEYQQKNQLLTQVEELKTNFLSMMSHDLKTPIARIQGMAEVVANDANPLSNRQQEALFTLRQSSQELLEFVSSILNLGRIESKELKLNLQSRDPNGLLEEVIGKLEYLAKSKKIEIIQELEPLFSVKMDVDLIRQVLSNLIENAIKYSPEGTRILVTSEEVENYVRIQVADQGQGIPEDELGHVFMKFYRSKNAKSSSIKGSGLGLYLARYFVELHRGRLSVDSRLNEGSTFTVELPVEK